MTTCTIDNCDKPLRTSKSVWCNMHYTRWWRHGDPLAIAPRTPRRHGATDPAHVRRFETHCELRITQRDGSVHAVLYDAEDATLVESYRWHVSESNSVPGLFYARATADRRNIAMHVLLMDRPLVDHINHNGLDNRRGNLRLATKGQNAANSIRRTRGKDSMFRGVGWRAHASKWVARLADRHLGYFETEVDAAKAYDAAATEMFGEFATLNFPAGKS